MSALEPIPFNDLRAAYLAQADELNEAAQRVFASGWYILGAEVAAFEQEFAQWTGAAGCVGVNSGTDALLLVLRALDIGEGDEVITVAHTAVATVAAVVLAGATPVLVDIDPTTYTMDPAAAEAAMTPRTRAIIAVHLYGQAADMQPLLALAVKHDLRLIEDCAQAHGATYFGRTVGTMGDAGCFSFYPTKNLGALGDGGAVISRDPALLEQVRLQREYGWTPAARYVSQVAGMNSRLDELQAALLRVKLKGLAAANEARRALASDYAQLLPPELTLPSQRAECRHVYHLYVVRAPSPALRESLRTELAAAGVGTGIHYPVPVHLQPGYAHQVTVAGSLCQTERAAQTVLSLPLHPALTRAHIECVAGILTRLLA
jgi:dTDP-4-amino-4,6-dideoxygalactose transaminase